MRSPKVSARLKRFGLYVTRYFDCNPLAYHPETCYNPLDTGLTNLWNRGRFRAVAKPYGVIHVDPRRIRWNLRVTPRKWPLGQILGGNWDLAFRRPVEIAWKIASMKQRFHLGLEWEETDLFRHFYAPRFEHQHELVKGAGSISELAAHYQRVYDALYESMREDGFKIPTMQDPSITFAYVHIDRSGEFLYTLEGNHRLGMALALELDSIPVRVVTRHLSWQLVREGVAARSDSYADDHPDLRDLTRSG